MNFIEYILVKIPELKEAYDKSLNEKIACEINRQKEKIPAHEWWRLEDIHVDESSIDLIEKYNILLDSFVALLEKHFYSKVMIKEIFDIIEFFLQSHLSEEEQSQIEVFFLESLVNYLEWEKKEAVIYELLGTETKKMWDKNRALWNSTKARNIGDLIRT